MIRRHVTISNRMYTSREKSEVRHAVVDNAIAYGCKNMLTVAGDRGIDAIMFASALPSTRVVSIEQDKKIFNRQQNNLREFKNIICLNANIGEFLSNGIKYFYKFDCVYLDYNCIYNKSVEDDVTSLFMGGKFSRDGVFALTICKGRDGIREGYPLKLLGTRLLHGVCCNDTRVFFKNREECIKTTMYQIAVDCGINLKEITCRTYRHGKTRGLTMMAFVFKTTNRKVLKNEKATYLPS